MTYIGSWGIDSLLTFSVTTHTFSTGAATDADSPPTYRVYEDETATPILTGTMALLDGSNTVAFYSEQITLSAANGLEKGKAYTIYITATVAGVVGVTERHFQIGAEVDAVYISGDILAAAALELAYDDTAGPVPELGIIDRGTAQSATGTTLVLRSGITVSDDVLIGATAYIYSSTNGLFGRRVINDWDSATDTATVDTWTVTPTGTIKYIVYPTPPASVASPAPVQVTDIVAAALAKFFSVNSGTTYASAVAGSVVKETADNAGGSALTPQAIRAVATGTSDSGTTTTMVDAARTEADTDYWKGNFILFTSGNISGQCRLITGFTPGTDTITFAPATTQAVATQTYEILPEGAVNIRQWLETTPNALISGRPDVTATAIAGDTTAGTRLANFAYIVARSNTAQAGGASTITLDTGASAINQNYRDLLVFMTSGPGINEARWITDYNGTTKVATVDLAWTTQPTSSSVFVVLNIKRALLDAATAGAGAVTAIQSGLATSAALATAQGNITSILAAVDTEIAAIISTLATMTTTLGTPAGASVSADLLTLHTRLTAARAGFLDFLNGTVAGRFKKNVAFANVPFYMSLTAGGPAVGLAPVVQISKDGAAFGALTTPTVTEIGAGWYRFGFAAGDLNADTVAVKATVATANQTNFTIITQAAA